MSDKIGLVGDAGALALSGEASTTSLLAFVKGFKSETNQLAWSQILGSLGTVKSVFSDDEAISGGLKKFTLELISPAVEKIGMYLVQRTGRILTNYSQGGNRHPMMTFSLRNFDLF